MAKGKRLRREHMQLKKQRRWEHAKKYLALVNAEEHRRFYARSTKYLLDSQMWNSSLRDQLPTDHANLVVMLLEFNGQKRSRMIDTNNKDVVLERSVVTPLTKGHKRRHISKHLWRFTHEFMRLIRSTFPAPSSETGRVTRMPEFARLFRVTFLASR